MMNYRPNLSSNDLVRVRVNGNVIDIAVSRALGVAPDPGTVETAFQLIRQIARDAAERVATVFRQVVPEGIEVRLQEASDGRSCPCLEAAEGNYFHGTPILVRGMWSVRIHYDWQKFPADHPSVVALRALPQATRASLLIEALTNNSQTRVEFGCGLAALRYVGSTQWDPYNDQLKAIA